ncbi:3-dehydroquinate synthase [Caloramator quimbayensis]|uniref:3-dehydroquinate synthase n=1 Tax=Caloramator quimbayensis TaxID=1147123 RepID=A0A1T4X3Z4_9CLOT|nr:3-dehydroquinate synthase [Caloramator quimbayensis]SKA83591.1 3-dehydroquinate synthase [Caloramator quimbayensis]
MKEIKIKASKEYDVIITSGWHNLLFQLENHKLKNFYIITDENVYNIHKTYFDLLTDKASGIFIIKAGEDYKNYDTISMIYEDMIKKKVNRKTAVIAIGGGVVGDLAGFAASTFMRGLRFVQIPTTLISQCDSSIGGKNGYNFNYIKNLIGNIYQPDLVYIDVNFLKTLSLREYINGMAEVIKYGFVCNKDFFNYLNDNKKGIMEREADKLLHIVYECVKIKGRVVEEDELDTDKRHILNFGHTIGHGIESASDFNILHGEAVSIGMAAESFIALKLGLIDTKSYDKLISLLKFFNLPVKFDLKIENILEYIKKDKKKISNDNKLVLPDGIGHAIITSEIKESFIHETLKEFTK